MAISIFPSTAAEFVSNNFIIDMNDTTNNTADPGGVKQAGPYEISFESGSETTFDIYLIDADGASVGYSNTTTIEASGLFSSVVILGVASDERITFRYAGSINNADGEGDEPGAGAYLESISPTDLPTIDDTATINGGNFGTDTEIKFESGATVLDAKNITVSNSTELIVTRPDNLDADLDPWTLRAITTGVPQPTGTNANLLVDAVTAGASPVWVTGSALPGGELNTAYVGATLEATDADGSVTYSITSGSLPTGLSLDSTTGVISGTPTGPGQVFTATATDDGGNQNGREFRIAIDTGTTGGTKVSSGGYIYHSFETSDDFVAPLDIGTLEYIVVAGGGPGDFYGGGGAGGLLTAITSLTAGTYAVAIGAGGAQNSTNSGSPSSIANIATATGGGYGRGFNTLNAGSAGSDGGSGGGGSFNSNFTKLPPGSGIAGQGFGGGIAGNNTSGGSDGGGGGAGEVGGNGSGNRPGDGGDGLQFSDFATATGNGADGGYYAGGGAGGRSNNNNQSAIGGLGGGATGNSAPVAGVAGTGGGGSRGGAGGSGIVLVRYV